MVDQPCPDCDDRFNTVFEWQRHNLKVHMRQPASMAQHRSDKAAEQDRREQRDRAEDTAQASA